MSHTNTSVTERKLYLSLAQQFGTPLYVYDANIIREQVMIFRRAFAALPVRIFYAAKALTNISVLKLMKQLGTGVDTVSPAEIQMALMAGFTPEEMVFTPNMVSFDEIEKAIETGIIINIENLSNLEKLGRHYGSAAKCFVRVSPDFITERDNPEKQEWQKRTKFGIPLSRWDEMNKIIHTYGIRVIGLHMHASHVIMQPTLFQRGASILFDLAKSFPDLKYLDFGGGYNIPGKHDAPETNLQELGKILLSLYQQDISSGKKPELWFEPGRFLVARAGSLLVETEIVKKKNNMLIAGTNSGFNHLIRPMLYGAWHDIENISNPKGAPVLTDVYGNLCEQDPFATDRMIPNIREGDVLRIRDAGGYGFMMSSQYNSRYRPAEVLLINTQPYLIRKRETQVDLLRNQILIDIPSEF
ncbi:MAG: diaminopimelate decarboxylase [Bacteroidales bacterium]|nr:diaminopimelate decarboxylase [Bacteroidales bacterium]